MKIMLYTLASLVCIANISNCMQPEQAHVVTKPFTPEQVDAFTQGARRGKIAEIRKLLETVPTIINEKDARDKRPALHRAAMGHLFDANEDTILNCYEIFQLLLEKGIDKKATDRDNRTVDVFINHKLTKYKNELPDLEERSKVLLAAFEGRLTGPVAIKLTPATPEQTFVQHARRGELAKMKAMLAENRNLLNAKNPREKCTALHNSAKGYVIRGVQECLEVFKFLIEEGADISVTEKNGLNVAAYINESISKNAEVTGIAERAERLKPLLEAAALVKLGSAFPSK